MTRSAELAAAALAAFDDARLLKAERLTGGVSADVHRLDLAFPDGTTRQVVLRAHGENHWGLPPAVEFQLMEALHAAGLPVPEPLRMDASGTILSDPYLIMAYVDGTTTLPEAVVDERLETMGETLARIHGRLPPGLPSLPTRIDPLPELFDFLPRGDEWEPLARHLRGLANTAYDGPPSLLHGDYWPENLLWQDARLAAILDWEDAAVGDPLSDLAAARLELSYRYEQDLIDLFTRAYVGDGKAPDPERLALWQIYVAAAAQRYMGDWGLPADREAHMRRMALASIREGAGALMASVAR